MQIEKKDIRALSKDQLRDFFVINKDKAFRGNQVYEWLWSKGAHSFEDMTNVSKGTRQMLVENFVINHIKVDTMQRSSDGTVKNAVRLHDGLIVESVLIPTETRTTACVSSQVGCSLDCNFCATARLKRMRNLEPGEIYDQVLAIDRESKLYFNRPLSNIVFMGMGEPLMNYNNVIKAIDMITSSEGLGMSPKRITVSTSGVSKMIKKMADDEVKFKLAVSLHSAVEEIRNKIMPFTKSFPLPELREALQYWYHKTKSKITYEYVVWKGINDNKESVDALVKFCKHVPCKVNLIEYNPIDDGEFQQASPESINAYIKALEANGIIAKVRHSRGKDIDAACGQLANKEI
ncbi:50S rRNA methyltransferase [Flavobacterium psychrophilum]|uniref:Probable dual-specificity RNA methyltransferase RlmN n=1 Tax=Flavobacterium psychrophilum (strain ATCC 49511 / DSM 21280 / CIP 103535 / JIP02/86) TaxID=402612 RepID=RLMN_FLAPJ|nr:23S rRNA (adenine(2503)-C(2))-methyltransferase RlmN [Flavobacterium psychrophilum]A6H1B8.1 RecName: Full=Probable dual-specificity RNA methyltransferase RlmN; AltName: Full=23S rRNA (adenine(2503)-C(2))-methyltransferase; AltName: Full=23S rRNA m2A2503 methyltransferase; AltName: Full=Ribosomal RNA large subunit methyltransferase N; AltName: Full=tRNA (adenine(37)-C(2))-methyltransferase; AltName: Full=tRNA m2A37 methyltransferase [Flavobacterium psychrophilum JIP02/86]AIG30825.1 50S rRNA met